MINSCFRIHFHNLPETLQEQLRTNKLNHLVGQTFSIPVYRSRIPPFLQRSNLLERPNSTQFKCQTRLLHSSEPEILMQTITELENTKSSPTLNELFPSVNYLSSQFIEIFRLFSHQYKHLLINH
jgi:hypothetical protein